MGKLVGVVLVVLAFWVGSELSTHGVEGAFGGIFSSVDAREELRSTPQRIGDRTYKHMKAGEDRVERMLAE